MSQEFGHLLRRFRLRAGLTQRGLAREIGIDASYVSHMERGRRVPQPDIVHLLAAALHLSESETSALWKCAFGYDPRSPLDGIGLTLQPARVPQEEASFYLFPQGGGTARDIEELIKSLLTLIEQNKTPPEKG